MVPKDGQWKFKNFLVYFALRLPIFMRTFQSSYKSELLIYTIKKTIKNIDLFEL